MPAKKRSKNMSSLILKAFALGMGVSSVVISILNVSQAASVVLLGLGVSSLALLELDKE